MFDVILSFDGIIKSSLEFVKFFSERLLFLLQKFISFRIADILKHVDFIDGNLMKILDLLFLVSFVLFYFSFDAVENWDQ